MDLSMKTVVCVPMVFLFFSCATILNQRDISIEIHTLPDSSKIIGENGTVIPAPVILTVPRSDHDFELTLKKDSTVKKVRIISKVSPEFKWGNLFLVYACPVGYCIDASRRENMYGYDNSLLININDNNKPCRKWVQDKSGQLYIRGSLPWFDFLEFDDDRGFNHYNAYMGLCAGFDLYYLKQTFVSLHGGFTGIDNIAIPVMDRFYTDTIDRATSISVKLTNNHDIPLFSTTTASFSIGYGLNFTRIHYTKMYFDSMPPYHGTLLKEKYISSFGPAFDFNILLFRSYFIGLNILPSFHTIKKQTNGLPYLSYIDFGIRLPLYRPEKIPIPKIKYKPKYIEQ